MSSEPKEN